LLAKIYDPEGAVSAGYLDELTTPDALLERARAAAARLGALSQMAFRATKKRLRGATIEHVVSSLEADMADMMVPTR
jgi:enoyl-CoA hydratase